LIDWWYLITHKVNSYAFALTIANVLFNLYLYDIIDLTSSLPWKEKLFMFSIPSNSKQKHSKSTIFEKQKNSFHTVHSRCVISLPTKFFSHGMFKLPSNCQMLDMRWCYETQSWYAYSGVGLSLYRPLLLFSFNSIMNFLTRMWLWRSTTALDHNILGVYRHHDCKKN